MQKGKFCIHATNIHQGGGKSLLWSLIQALPSSVPIILQLDSRMPLPKGMSDSMEIRRVPPSILQRIKAERWLAKRVSSEDIVLCFGNLPPLFMLRGYTVVFVQNRYLIDDVKLSGFSLKVQLRLIMERLWLSRMIPNADEFIVQTPTMKRLMEKKSHGKVPVRILPFTAGSGSYARCLAQTKVQKINLYDFVYVASGEPHKNHRQLIEAWCLLASEGLFPSLCLTLNKVHFAGLCQEIEALRLQYRLNVKNAGELSHQDVLVLYKSVGAMIYPSNFESFGLPLIEARQAGLPVLASELDYVRDVLDADQTFDPESPTSIARAVKRHIGKEEQALPLLDTSTFIRHLIGSKG